MEIPVIMPWSSDNNIGKAYNQVMQSILDWVLLLDHDVMLLDPEWYRILIATVEKLGHEAGWITGRTNLTFCLAQLDQTAPKTHDLMAHMKHAKHCRQTIGDRAEMFRGGVPFSGYMILTHRKAWEDSGGFNDGLLGVDNYYHIALLKKSYKTYTLPGFYVYHMHKAKAAWHQF